MLFAEMDRDLARAPCPHSPILIRGRQKPEAVPSDRAAWRRRGNDTLSVFSFPQLPAGWSAAGRNGIEPWARLRIQHLAGCVGLTQLSKVSEVLRLW